MAKNTNLSSRKTLGDSVFSFVDLDSAWPSYKNSLIFIQEQNWKFKFFRRCYLKNFRNIYLYTSYYYNSATKNLAFHWLIFLLISSNFTSKHKKMMFR